MTEVKFMIVCKACSTAVSPEDVLDHMREAHGISADFLLKSNINNYYAAAVILDGWPEQHAKRRK